jgi:hypothetical protein
MQQNVIFLPVATLALWTLAVLGLIPLRRFTAAFAKKVTADDFRFGESTRVPGDVAIANRAWMNLLEAPVLFYVACLIWFVIGAVDEGCLALAWGYVALRIAHTLIHVTYNHVFHRLVAFALSNGMLIALWIRLLLALLETPA